MTGITVENTTRGRLLIDGRFCVLYGLLLLLLFPVHESGHWLVYRSFDVPTRFTLNTVSPLVRSQRRPQAEIAGPFVNVVIAVVDCSCGAERTGEVGLRLRSPPVFGIFPPCRLWRCWRCRSLPRPL